MLSLMYVSTSTYPMGASELAELLEGSRVNNARLGITGLLLYKEEQFMQVIEGPEAEVLRLFSHIGADERHHSVKSLAEKTIRKRKYSRWSMGFRQLDEAQAREIPGYSAFLGTRSAVERNALDSREEILLEWFRTR